MQKRVGDTDEVEGLFEEMRHRRFGDTSQQDRAHRDAQLGARQHQREVFSGPDDGDGTGFALFGQRLEAVTAGRDQREF